MGDISFSGNIINSTEDYGIEVDYLEDFGENLNGNASFMMGNIEFNDNVIYSSEEGLYFNSFEYFGCIINSCIVLKK